MKEKYTEVPEIITGKDLDYLSDMFQWNYEVLKKAYDSMEVVQDQDLIEAFSSAATLMEDNINSILEILTNLGGEANE